jgi:hypothetical protein
VSDRETTYIERIARKIWELSGGREPWPSPNEKPLYLGYAVLAIVKGTHTTSADVHEAWSAWATVLYDGSHRSIVPFDDLEPFVQAYDDEYRDAIHKVVPMIPDLVARRLV